MTSDEKEENRGFKVQDRRRFSESGEVRDNDAPRDDRAAAHLAAAAPPVPPASAEHDIEINFSTFVISLSTQAFAHLGEIPSPIENTIAIDLPAARQVIDILAMLRDKTTGNLDPPEQALLDNILYDLRMRYVESTRQRQGP